MKIQAYTVVKVNLHVFLNLGTNGVGQLHTPTALPTREEPVVSIVQEDEWALVPVWTRWRRGKSLPLLGRYGT